MAKPHPTARAVGYDLAPLRGFSKCRLFIGDTRARKWPNSRALRTWAPSQRLDVLVQQPAVERAEGIDGEIDGGRGKLALGDEME